MAGPRSARNAAARPGTDAAAEVPIDIRVGDTIVYSKYGGREITIDGEDLLILNARDVLAVAEVSRGQAGQAPDLPRRLVDRLARMMAAVSEIQAEEAVPRRDALLKAMMAAGIDAVPPETVSQARRLARQRERLLATGAFSTEALRVLRGDAKSSTTRTWLARRRSAGEIFTASHDGRTLVPAFELDHEGRPRTVLRSVLAALAPAELTGWATWTWFTATSSWLGGATPVDQLETDPERVVRAASRFTANATA